MAKKIEQIEHPEIIRDILESATPQAKAILELYMRSMVEAIVEAREVAETAVEQRNKIIGFVDELVDSLKEIFAPTENKTEAETVANELFNRIKQAANK